MTAKPILLASLGIACYFSFCSIIGQLVYRLAETTTVADND
jgi:hypothetical protein